jgi:flagellar biosynthesis protein FlhG
LKSQLEAFRELVELRQSLPSGRAVSIAVASGKGGVGKSNIALGLACAWRERQQEVLLLDGDPGMADLHILAGIHSDWHWGHLLEGTATLEQIQVAGPLGMRVVTGFSGVASLDWLRGGAMRQVLRALHGVSDRNDRFVIDVGAGLSESTIAFCTTADLLLLVLTSELTSLADAYGMVKTIRKWNPAQPIAVVVNQVGDESEGRRVWESLGQVCDRFLAYRPEWAGWLPREPLLPQAVMRQRPMLEAFPQSTWSQGIRSLIGTLDTRLAGPRGGER